MKPKIKLLVDCHVFDGNAQGTTTYLKGIYCELINNKNILFYFISFYPQNLKKIFGEQDNIIYLKYPSKNKFKRLLIDLPLIIKKYSIDFAHFQYIVPPIKNCKFIVTIHDILFINYPEYFPFLYKIKNKLLFYFSTKKSDFVLTVSEYSKKKIEKHFNIKNIKITNNAVDKVFFNDYNKEEIQKQVLNKFNIEKYFLYVSRREPRKNHLNLLKAFIEGNFYKNYQLVFVGKKDIIDQEFDKYFKNLSLEYKKRIVFLENINFENLVSITKGATLSIYPSKAEGFGIPPLESIAANIPTICSNTTSMKEFTFLKDYFFNPNSVNQITEKIHFALTNHNKSFLKEQLKEKYSWNKSANILNNILENN